uniref:Uncharacterized protein n=1 Tax=Gossypium raimondii TaxID=29730 RepID=A0A0D2UUW0_GOSRA|nr:hypothetical protein B456_011G168500 [Gossypium raimondii]
MNIVIFLGLGAFIEDNRRVSTGSRFPTSSETTLLSRLVSSKSGRFIEPSPLNQRPIPSPRTVCKSTAALDRLPLSAATGKCWAAMSKSERSKTPQAWPVGMTPKPRLLNAI